MARAAGLLNLLQGVVYGVLAGYFSQRWPPGTLLLGGAAYHAHTKLAIWVAIEEI